LFSSWDVPDVMAITIFFVAYDYPVGTQTQTTAQFRFSKNLRWEGTRLYTSRFSVAKYEPILSGQIRADSQWPSEIYGGFGIDSIYGSDWGDRLYGEGGGDERRAEGVLGAV
jgi:hypothetical protein